jgi:hypothetical protein
MMHKNKKPDGSYPQLKKAFIRKVALQWGLTTAAICELFVFVFDYKFSLQQLISVESVIQFIISLIVFPLFGILMGLAQWNARHKGN